MGEVGGITGVFVIERGIQGCPKIPAFVPGFVPGKDGTMDFVFYDECAEITEAQWRSIRRVMMGLDLARGSDQSSLGLPPQDKPGEHPAAAVDPSQQLGGDIVPIVGQDPPAQG